MVKQICFVLCFLLVIGALASHSASQAYLSKSTMLLAKSLTIEGPSKTEAKTQSDSFSRKGSILYYLGLGLGLGLAIASFVLWIASGPRRESAWRLIVPILLGVYVLMQFIRV